MNHANLDRSEQFGIFYSVNVHVRRLGGGFGAKISKATLIATACAVAAHVTNKPVRIVLDLETNMTMIGKRLPYLLKYEVCRQLQLRYNMFNLAQFVVIGTAFPHRRKLMRVEKFTSLMQTCTVIQALLVWKTAF